MGPPTPESLAGMGLLGKKDSIKTEILYLRDDAKRADYFDKFQANNRDVEDLKQVKWGLDSSPTSIQTPNNASRTRRKNHRNTGRTNPATGGTPRNN